MNLKEQNGSLLMNEPAQENPFESLSSTPQLDWVEDGETYVNHCTFSTDTPVKVSNPVACFTDLIKGKLICQVETAFNYCVHGTGVDVVDCSYSERIACFNNRVKEIFSTYAKERTAEYLLTVQHYRGVDCNNPGCYSWKTLTCQEGCYFVCQSVVHTQNADWKKGPMWTMNSVTWCTGSQGPSETCIEVDAIYHPEYIKCTVISELNQVRQELISRGIATELPRSLTTQTWE